MRGTMPFLFEAKEASLKALWKLRASYPLQSQMWHTKVFWMYEKSNAIMDLFCALSHLKLTRQPVQSIYIGHRWSQGSQGKACLNRNLNKRWVQSSRAWGIGAKGNAKCKGLRTAARRSVSLEIPIWIKGAGNVEICARRSCGVIL